MDWLNYHHLLYFWTVAREGSITKASEVLRLAPSTVSVQIKMLEEAMGVDLFERRGRRLIMTDAGRIAFSYAGEIFQLGQELLNTFKSQPVGRPLRLVVGVADVLWKEIAHQLVRPATTLETPVHLVCVEGSVDELLAEMAIHNIDVVLADSPLGPSVGVKAFNHLLGKSGVGFFGSAELAETYGPEFPASLNGAPMLLPTMRTSLRRHLDQWFQTNSIRPHIIAEFDDSAMMTKFGSAGEGLFPAPTVVADDLADSNNVQLIGEADKVQQRFYAISPERRIKLPAVQAICEAARQSVFS